MCARHYLASHFTPSVLDAQRRHLGRAQVPPASAGPDLLGPEERAFIARRDSFYLGSVTESGAPYLQHRGGPAGFLRVLDERTLAFSDFGGNRQLLTVGHLAREPRVALFLMDYPGRSRLKIDGVASVVAVAEAEPELAAALGSGTTPRVGVGGGVAERIIRIAVSAFDWNCPKYITPRFTSAEVAELVAPLRLRIAALEAALRSAGRALPD